MKKLIFILTVPLFMAACTNHHHVYQQLIDIDSLLNREQTDSVFRVIKQIDTTQFSDEERAYYYLLKVQAMWKEYIPIPSDTLLNYSLSYYEKTAEKEKLARVYYYKGALLYDKKRTNEAVDFLKKAEKLADDGEYIILKNKVYSTLRLVNSQAGEYLMALGYAKKALECSKKMNNLRYLVDDLECLGVCYYRVGEKDSAVWYLEQCLPLIRHARREDQARLLGNLGLMYKKIDLERAEKLLGQSIEIEPYEFVLNSLANIYKDRGETEKAESLYVKALRINRELQTKINILTAYRNLKSAIGDYQAANEIAGQITALKDSLSQERKTENVGLQQVDFDYKVEKEQTSDWIWYAKIVIIVLMVILTILFYYYILRTKKMRKNLKDSQQLLLQKVRDTEETKRQIEKLKKKSRLQGDQLKNAERKVELLKKEQDQTVEKMMQEHKNMMMHGNQLYDELMRGGNMVLWSTRDMRDFQSYYIVKNPLLSTKIDSEYYQLTPSQYVYLILRDMEIDDNAIMQTMNMTEGSFRTMRSRLNKRKRL